MKMQIQLATAPGIEPIIVSANTVWPFGMHKNPDGNGRPNDPRAWTVTHVQSGLKIGDFRTRRLALMCAEALIRTATDWDFSDGKAFNPEPSTLKLCSSIIRYYQLQGIEHASPTDLVLA